MACWYGGRTEQDGGLKRVGSVMKSMRLWNWIPAADCVCALGVIITRGNAGFFLRGFSGGARRCKLVAEYIMTWDRRRCEQGIRPIKQAVIIT